MSRVAIVTGGSRGIGAAISTALNDAGYKVANLSGVFNMTHPCWPGMRERKFGRIITISSINGQKG